LTAWVLPPRLTLPCPEDAGSAGVLPPSSRDDTVCWAVPRQGRRAGLARAPAADLLPAGKNFEPPSSPGRLVSGERKPCTQNALT
jgi:hypothetical protein